MTERDDRPLSESIKDEALNQQIQHRVFAKSLTDAALADVCDWAADKEPAFHYAAQLSEAARRLRERA